MVSLSIHEAAKRAGTSKVDIWLAIQEGALRAQKTDGGLAIDPAELFRVFEPQPLEERPTGQDASVPLEASEQPEIAPGTSPTHETATANDAPVAACAAELKDPVELPAGAPANDELPPNREKRQPGDSRTAPLAELAAERAKADKAITTHISLEKRGTPWWRRLIGWIRTRRGRAARERLRERV